MVDEPATHVFLVEHDRRLAFSEAGFIRGVLPETTRVWRMDLVDHYDFTVGCSAKFVFGVDEDPADFAVDRLAVREKFERHTRNDVPLLFRAKSTANDILGCGVFIVFKGCGLGRRCDDGLWEQTIGLESLWQIVAAEVPLSLGITAHHAASEIAANDHLDAHRIGFLALEHSFMRAAQEVSGNDLFGFFQPEFRYFSQDGPLVWDRGDQLIKSCQAIGVDDEELFSATHDVTDFAGIDLVVFALESVFLRLT